MCRLLAYWGAPVPVADLVVRSAHSLLRQCTDARRQSSGCENPDGWGIGWYVPGQPDPFRYRSATPMPLDHDGVAALDGLESPRFVAHVRHKSPGSPTEVAGNAPFVSGRWLFAHNGFVEGFRDGRRDQLFAQLSPARQEALQGDADSELLFGLILDRLDAGEDAAVALAVVLEPLVAIGGRYNVVLTDGEQLLATCLGNSLFLRFLPWPIGNVIASEPYDDAPVVPMGHHAEAGEWQQLTDGTLVELDDDNGSETSSLFQGAHR
ncbi:MAG: class II glutamine amidotransferase [Acidimicrobiales bacterium]